MAAKADVLEQLGEASLVLPELINRSLAANDRIKYYLTLLQAARDHALHPNIAASSLSAERLASGVDDSALDMVVAASVKLDDESLSIPHAGRIHERVVDGIGRMLDPFRVAPGVSGPSYEQWHNRLAQVLGALAPPQADRVAAGYVDSMTRADKDAGDSMHLLLIDLHRGINTLQSAIAAESLGGAKAYGVTDADRPLVEAFMAGVNSTAGLKFDHPGLGTTATRVEKRLVLQNDLGATDVHVLVVHVIGLTIRIIYTDIHAARVAFFEDMLEPLGLTWNEQPAPKTRAFLMRVGEVTVKDETILASTLTRIGSRLVFLIDWNRARKRLGRLLRKRDAQAVLRWAADHDVGHRAFLQLGDVQLVGTAMEHVARAQVRFGARLDEVLGRASAIAFIQAVLRITADGLHQARSARLIQDEIEAELLAHFQSAEQRALQLAEEHASLVAALAGLARDAVERLAVEPGAEAMLEFARRAKRWETLADDVVKQSRDLFGRVEPGSPLLHLLAEADDVADGLEESAFLLTLVPGDHVTKRGVDGLRELADLIARGSREYVRCVACGEEAHRAGARAEIEEFLIAVDAVMAFEHASDERERAVAATLVDACQEFRELHVLSEVAKNFESAADALGRCAIILRDYVLNSLKAR